MGNSLRVLIVNNTLNGIAGTELYVLELAKSLQKLGHKPVAYSTELGPIADRLRWEGISVTDDLETLGVIPDIIHGHHHLDTLAALLYFPNTPAIYYCHGPLAWQEHPLIFPRIYKYVAVCDLTTERFIVEGGIAPEKINLIPNFVDLSRFKPRGPLPRVPKKALAFSGYMNIERLNMLKSACQICGIPHVDAIGTNIGKTHSKPEELLGKYDLVFAKGRAALEALASGASVISCDGSGSMVTMGNLAHQRFVNFGLSARHYPYSIDTMVQEIRNYDSSDAAKVSEAIRTSSGKDAIIKQIIDLYNEAIELHRVNPNKDITLEQKAISRYLRFLRINFKNEVTKRMVRETKKKSRIIKRLKKLVKFVKSKK